MGFGVNISIELGFLLNCIGLSPEGLAGFTWGGYIVLPFSFFGGDCFIGQYYQDLIAIVYKYSCLSIFLTFTANFK